MTELLHLRQHPGIDPPAFIAQITEITEEGIILDQTGFYPQGGGQPSDFGIVQIGGQTIDVKHVGGRGIVLHKLDSSGLSIGDKITGTIDVGHRNALAHMHTAQHLVSALANDLWGAETVGNQIGPDKTRIDLKFEDRDAFDADQLREFVNENIRKDLAVEMDFMPQTELRRDPRVRINLYRLPPAIESWRTIQIGEVDLCPCAGTHVASTGTLRPIEISRVKSKGAGKLRVEYIFKEQ